MAYTAHGHQISGTPAEGPRPAFVARCGGPRLCDDCAHDAERARAEIESEKTLAELRLKLAEKDREDADIWPTAQVPVYIGEEHKAVGRADISSDGTAIIRIDPLEGSQLISRISAGQILGLSLGYDYREGPATVLVEGLSDHHFTD